MRRLLLLCVVPLAVVAISYASTNKPPCEIRLPAEVHSVGSVSFNDQTTNVRVSNELTATVVAKGEVAIKDENTRVDLRIKPEQPRQTIITSSSQNLVVLREVGSECVAKLSETNSVSYGKGAELQIYYVSP